MTHVSDSPLSEADAERELEVVGSQFDFGKYEAKAYVTILEHGSMTASEVAEQSGIPKPRVYDTIRNLAEYGVIELHESRPMRVVAIDPEQAFTDVLATIDALVDELADRFRTPARDGAVVSLVKSRQTVLRYIEEVITAATFELVLVLPPALLDRYESTLQDRRTEGVSIDLLLSPAADAPHPTDYDYSQVATTARTRRGTTTPVLAVADGSYAVFAPRDTLSRTRSRDQYGVLFNRSELGFLVCSFLNTVVWPSANTLTDPGNDSPFPRKYASIRRCARDLQEFSGTFYATIRGREVDSGERVTISGEVRDISVSTNRETAAITVDTADGPIDVGGQLAALEDLEAFECAIGRDDPPPVQDTP